MNESLTQSWWILAFRGVVAILFGALALMWPGLTLLWLVALFAAYALLSGCVAVAGVVNAKKNNDDPRWLLLLLGVVSIGAGIIALVHPALTALILILVIGANALITGVLDIAIALRLRKMIHGEGLMFLNGAAAIVFGVLTFLFPSAGALAFAWLISLYALVTGALLLAFALRMRARAVEGTRPAGHPDRRVIPDRRVSSARP